MIIVTKRSFAAYIILLLLVSSLLSCRQNFSSPETQIAKANTEKIISALEIFYKENLYYPDTLDVLVPDYILKLPAPRESKFPVKFGYELIETNGQPEYQLYFFSHRKVFFTTKARDVFIYRPSGKFPAEYLRGDKQSVVTNKVYGNWAWQTWSRKQ